MRRVFLGWNKPAIVSAAEFLLERHATGREANLAGFVVALPGARAGRRLLEVLVELAETRGMALVPPRIVTIGHLPEELYDRPAPFAGRLAKRLAWMAALDAVDADLLRPLAVDSAASQRLAMAELIERLHDELAGYGLKFADVRSRLEHVDRSEDGRWQALVAVQGAFETRLAQIGLVDQQLARLKAIDDRACRAEREIVLLGVADLSPASEKMLQQPRVSERVTALVSAPEEFADRFDPTGGLVVERWCQAALELADDQLVVVNRPGDQATAVVRRIADLAGRYAADQITVGVPDAEVVPYLQRRFEQFDLPSRYGEAVRLSQTAPYRLLAAVSDYLEGGRFADLAALVRHPDVQLTLGPVAAPATASRSDAEDLLTALDTYYCEHLQARLSDRPLGGSAAARRVAVAQAQIDALLKSFQRQAPLGEWAKRIADLLIAVYAPQQLDRGDTRGRLVLEACETLHGVLMEASELDSRLAGRWQAAEATRLLLRQVESEPIPPTPDQAAIELLGWLELPLDDAPVLIVTGFNDGHVPSFVNSDPFLPNALRRQLGLLDNDRRYARDAYALAALLGTRERLTLIAGRRSAEGDPLTPSRLAFACPREQMARRVLGYYGRESMAAGATVVPPGLPAGARRSRFAPPKPRPVETPVDSMRVTQFRDYLACPYRYYLRHVLLLRTLSDLAEELEPAAFGSLAHDALRQFGADPDNSLLTDPEAIARRLDYDLARLVSERFGRHRLPAVDLQVEHLRLRLAAFARWQAGWAKQGWRIVKTEIEITDQQAPLKVDGKPMYLKARLDRVDRHDLDGRHVIFDYKTADSGDPPDKTHRAGGEWIDLQLPLYRHLASALGIDGPLELGYIVLPKDIKKITGHVAEWTADDLRAADERAYEVVRGIWSQTFLPMKKPPPAFSQEFAAICLDGQFGAMTEDDEGA